MTALFPAASYPDAPIIVVSIMDMPISETRVSMVDAFAEAQTDIASDDLENPYRSCAILTYLRDAHRVAVNSYDSSKTPAQANHLSVPIEQHRAVTNAQPPKCEP